MRMGWILTCGWRLADPPFGGDQLRERSVSYFVSNPQRMSVAP